MPGVIQVVGGREQLIEVSQRSDLGHGHQMPAPEPPDFALDAALFVAPHQTWATEKRVESIVATQRDEPLGLLPTPTTQYPNHRRFEIVIPNPPGHTTQPFKRADVALQE